MAAYYKMAQYRDCCCADCAEFGAEADDECEVFNAAVVTLPQGFGEGINPAPCTSICREFRPSDELLRNMAEAEAYRSECAARDSAWRQGAHA